MKKLGVNLKTYMKIFSKSLIFLFLAVMFALPANAALQGVGPINPANGFPLWYKDLNGLPLGPCLDQNGFCILPLAPEQFIVPPNITGVLTTTFDPALPIVFPTNFPSEAFYYVADAITNVGPAVPGGVAKKATLRMALEGSFAGVAPNFDPIPTAGKQLTFIRINLRIAQPTNLVPLSTYTVTLPFTPLVPPFVFNTDAVGNVIIPKNNLRAQDGCLLTPCDFTLLLPAADTQMDTFLTETALPLGGILDPVTGNRYIGHAVLPHAITPGPNGGFFRIDGPGAGGIGINFSQTNQWTVAGRIADTIPPVIVATSATPPVIDISMTSVLSATVTDDIGVAQVIVDLSQIGGLPNASMTLFSGNRTNGIWHKTVNSTIAGTVPFILPVTAIDGGGNTAVSNISLSVTNLPIVTAVPNIVTIGNATNVTITVTQGGLAVSGATVNLTGAVLPAPLTGTTDALGNVPFSINATAAGTITVTANHPLFVAPGTSAITAAPPFIKGCVVDPVCTATAGKPNIVDALFIAQQTVGLRTFTTTQMAAGDVNADGAVNIVDALFIAQFTVGLRIL